MFPYESLKVYQLAVDYHSKIFHFLKQSNLPAYINNQLGRASLSISLNIAEGSAKYSNRDRKNFFVIARGSSFECAAIVQILRKEEIIAPDFHNTLMKELDEISRMLYAMIKNLQ